MCMILSYGNVSIRCTVGLEVYESISGNCKQCTGRHLMFFSTQKHKQHILFPGGGGWW